MTLRLLHLYPNLMDLYGDSGNLQILKYRAEQRGIKLKIDGHTVDDPAPDFTKYDLIFLGGGSDKEQKVVARDIRRHAAALQSAYAAGVFILTICGGFQLFGQSYKDAEDHLIKGLGLFDFHTESSTDKRQRCIGNIVIETELNGKPVKLVGFENHGGQTHGVTHPFGRVLFGNGNTFQNTHEGMMTDHFIGTYLHGPLLSKNPELSDFILHKLLARKARPSARKSNTSAKTTPDHTSQSLPALTPLDDHFELQARQEILDKLL